MFYDVIVEMPCGSRGFIGYADFQKAREHYKRINGNYLHKKMVTESGEVLFSYANPTHFIKDLRKARAGFLGWVHRNIGMFKVMRATVRVKRLFNKLAVKL